MTELKKTPGRDFVVLNLSDIQTELGHWNRESKEPVADILEYTVRELIRRVHPDLITVSGDVTTGGELAAYEKFYDFLETFETPWALVWGNHDHDAGRGDLSAHVTALKQRPHSLFEEGPASLGSGNYVIRITENSAPVAALVMMDTNNMDEYVNENGEKTMVWARLRDDQIAWYVKEAKKLKADGFDDVTMIGHTPIYGYREAYAAAKDPACDMNGEDPFTENPDRWNEGYKDSKGVLFEGISSYPEDEGALEAFLGTGNTRRLIAGHDHVDDFMIKYRGIEFIYTLHTGIGCYYDRRLNGGTVITFGDEVTAHHEFVDITRFFDTEEK
ncbi:MAG: metallophosphoesterase [Clostridia bacterium]|nr:metallophosphoesterase [Clostridia bacterium]